MRGMFVRVLVSAILFLGTKLLEEIINEMEKTEENNEARTNNEIIQVLPRAMKVFSGK